MTIPSWNNVVLIWKSYLIDCVVLSVFNALHGTKSQKMHNHIFHSYTGCALKWMALWWLSTYEAFFRHLFVSLKTKNGIVKYGHKWPAKDQTVWPVEVEQDQGTTVITHRPFFNSMKENWMKTYTVLQRCSKKRIVLMLLKWFNFYSFYNIHWNLPQ